MTSLVLLVALAQPAPPLTDRECFERSVEGCLCQGEQHLRDVTAKAMAYDELLKHPPECTEAAVGAWGTAALLLLEALRFVWGALSERLVRDAEWEASFCHPPPAGFYEPQFCWDGRTEIGLRLQRRSIGNASPRGRRDPRW